MEHMSDRALGAPVDEDQSVSTFIRESESQRLGDGRLGLFCPHLSRRLGAEAHSRVLREARAAAREAHGPHGFGAVARFSSMAYWRLLRRVDGVWPFPPDSTRKEPGSYKSKLCETRGALVWIYRREWAALSIVS